MATSAPLCASPKIEPAAPSAADAAPFRIRFEIDKRYEKDLIYEMFHNADPAGSESRARSMRIPAELAAKILKAKDRGEVGGDIDRLVDPEYERLSKTMGEALLERQAFWDTHLAAFSVLVKEVTGFNWFHPDYLYYVTAFQRGASSWYGNTIAGAYDLKNGLDKRIFSHELLLSHSFHIMRKYVPPDEIDDWKVWAFSEITAVLIMEDHRFDRFWPTQVHRGAYFSQSGYPQLAPLEADLRAAYLQRKDFPDFVHRAVPILKKFDNAFGAYPSAAPPYLSLADARVRKIDDTYIATMRMKGTLQANAPSAPVEFDLLIDTDQNANTRPWGALPSVQDIGVDCLARVIWAGGRFSAEVLDFRTPERHRERIDFSINDEIVEFRFRKESIGDPMVFDYVFAVRQYRTGGDGYTQLNMSRLPRGTFKAP
ncbi:MAG: hypothetical protein PHU21_10125 [Elusimicrobia bacterium]|nr:hypothetical protein [Elusimicrobiota bacterium]